MCVCENSKWFWSFKIHFLYSVTVFCPEYKNHYKIIMYICVLIHSINKIVFCEDLVIHSKFIFYFMIEKTLN